jgi:hypothetical protein
MRNDHAIVVPARGRVATRRTSYTAEVLPRANLSEAVMFPVTSEKLSFADISDYWSRHMRTAEPPELLALLEQAWWRGEIRGQAGSTRLQLLQSMFSALGKRADLGIVFITEGNEPPAEVTELANGGADFDLRPRIRVPAQCVSDWNEKCVPTHSMQWLKRRPR